MLRCSSTEPQRLYVERGLCSLSSFYGSLLGMELTNKKRHKRGRPQTLLIVTGREINFFSDSHLAPKIFKVVANSKKVGRHFQRQTKSSLRCQRSR